MKRVSLSARVTLLLGLAALVILGAAAFTMDHMVDSEMGRRMDDGLLTEARSLASLVAVGPHGLDMDDVPRAPPHLLTGKSTTSWAVRCGDGRVAESVPPPASRPAGWMHVTHVQPTFANVHSEHGLLRAVWFRFVAGEESSAAGDGTSVSCDILFMRPRTALDDTLTTIDGILLLIPLLALVAVLVSSPALVRHGLKPIAALGEAMRGIGPGAPGQRLQPTGTRELEPLVGRFNDVLTRMDEGMTRERRFAGALAHETRTYVAELRSLVEVEQRYPGGQPINNTLGEIGAVVGQLQAMVSGLLLLTRLEGGIEDMDPQPVSLHAVVDGCLAHAEWQRQARRQCVEQTRAGSECMVVADRALLDIVVGNLVNNAFAYAPEGSIVGIRWQRRALVVDNDAPDVGADDVAHFGQRFWSRHHGVAGHAGLGLALAGAAAAAMHFGLDFRLDARGRLRVALSWPRELEVA